MKRHGTLRNFKRLASRQAASFRATSRSYLALSNALGEISFRLRAEGQEGRIEHSMHLHSSSSWRTRRIRRCRPTSGGIFQTRATRIAVEIWR